MLDGSNFMASGWVHGMKLHQYKTSHGFRFVAMGKVSLDLLYSLTIILSSTLQCKHSQRTSATPFLPWVVMEKKGEILCAHCNCMAG